MDLIENEWFIEAPWGKVALIAWGDCSDIPVLLCHGKQDSAASFKPLVSLLPRRYYYIAIDLPGNGKSDSLPLGLPIQAYDLAYTLKLVANHFSWNKFIYIGHSLGTHLGKLFNETYPGRISVVVDLDPTPSYYPLEVDDFPEWYKRHFGRYFEDENYRRFNAGQEYAPKYTYEKAFEIIKKNRRLTDEGTKHALDRNIEPAGDGLYRFTFDQRMKRVPRHCYPRAQLEKVLTAIKTPTLTIVAEETEAEGYYDAVPFIYDESRHPNGNYKCIRVPGNHDLHLCYPERISGPITEFMVKYSYGLSKSKL